MTVPAIIFDQRNRPYDSVQITCFDRTGKEVKRVTSTDEGNVEDPENENQNGNQN